MRELFETTIERIFSDLVSPALIHQCADGAWPGALWNTLEAAEMTWAAVPETLGGAGATWEDVYTLVRAAGAHAVPAPFADTLLANWLLGRAGLQPVQGPVAIAAHSNLTYTDGHASGQLDRVPWGRHLRRMVAIAAGRNPQIVVLDTASAAQVGPRTNLAGEPRDTITFHRAPVIHAAPLPTGSHPEDLLLYGAMLRSAQMAGALQSLLQMTARYAAERVQFGKPIGQFQVIQQQIAVFAEHTACSLLAAEAAFAESAIDIGRLPIMAAKICAGEAAGIGASIAHAIHGAIGFTDEHSLHLKTRRLWAWRAEYGSQSYWSQRLGQCVCESGSRALWPMLTQPATPRRGAVTETLL
ncbi:MAG: acyl-CoA dehydrogenase family protein [Steroidobacteraceae bacterium]